MKVLLKKFNWKQLLLHGLAMWLLIKAFSIIAYLLYPDIVLAYLKNNNADRFDMQKLNDFNWALAYCEMAGFFAASIISFFISIRKRWFWGNTILIMIGMLCIYRTEIPVWDYAKVILLAPGRIAEGIVLPFVINGIFLFFISLFLFFWPGIIKLIDKSGDKKITSPKL